MNDYKYRSSTGRHERHGQCHACFKITWLPIYRSVRGNAYDHTFYCTFECSKTAE